MKDGDMQATGTTAPRPWSGTKVRLIYHKDGVRELTQEELKYELDYAESQIRELEDRIVFLREVAKRTQVGLVLTVLCLTATIAWLAMQLI